MNDTNMPFSPPTIKRNDLSPDDQMPEVPHRYPQGLAVPLNIVRSPSVAEIRGNRAKDSTLDNFEGGQHRSSAMNNTK